MQSSRRDVAPAVGAAVILAATLVIPWRLHALAVAGATLVILAGVFWGRREHDLLRQRIAGAAIAGLAGFAAAFVVVAETCAGTFVLGAAIVALCVAGIERTRLRGAPVPVQAAANGRVAFEGTVHAIGDPPHAPGTDRDVAMWVARHERRRWTSTSRFEIRNQQRRVLVEPEPMHIRDTPRLIGGATWEAAAHTLGVDTLQPRRLRDPIHVWSFDEGEHVYIVGKVKLEDDPSAPALRDPVRVSVYGGDVLIGTGRLVDARRRADVQVWMWSAIAVGAVALMAAGLGGRG